MKKFFLTLFLSSLSITVFATITNNGYYRVKNYGTQRWASLVDNKAVVDKIAGSVELHSLELNNDTEEILSDPGSIVYVSNISGKRYDVATQGTSLERLFDEAVYITPDGSADGQTLYQIYGVYKNFTRYVADVNLQTNQQYGEASVYPVGGIQYRRWMFVPVDVNSNNYFGATPSLNINGNLYTTLFTSFPYSPYSAGVKAYYIGRVGFGMAEMIEINGAVPTASPVIIQCAGQNVADNKLQITSTQTALPSNALSGVYFNYDNKGFVNHIAYNKDTMRVLGKTSDGSLGFITATNLSYIPANTAYLRVPEGSPAEFKCVSTGEYEANLPDAPEQIFIDSSKVLQPQDDYIYSGSFYYPYTSPTITLNFYAPSADGTNVTLGAASSSNVNVSFTNDQSVPFVYGSNSSWVINNWKGGYLYITVNLQYQLVNFSKTAGVESIDPDNVDSLTYVGNKVMSDGEIKIYNLSGQLIDSSTTGSFDMATLPKGVYVAVSKGRSIKIAR